jgi:type IV secretory pathway protease TraF
VERDCLRADRALRHPWQGEPARGERVAIEPPPELRRLLAERHYLPTGVPLIKRIAAVRGQRVCRFAHGITIDGQYVGAARARDRLGRPLPPGRAAMCCALASCS